MHPQQCMDHGLGNLTWRMLDWKAGTKTLFFHRIMNAPKIISVSSLSLLVTKSSNGSPFQTAGTCFIRRHVVKLQAGIYSPDHLSYFGEMFSRRPNTDRGKKRPHKKLNLFHVVVGIRRRRSATNCVVLELVRVFSRPLHFRAPSVVILVDSKKTGN